MLGFRSFWLRNLLVVLESLESCRLSLAPDLDYLKQSRLTQGSKSTPVNPSYPRNSARVKAVIPAADMPCLLGRDVHFSFLGCLPPAEDAPASTVQAPAPTATPNRLSTRS